MRESASREQLFSKVDSNVAFHSICGKDIHSLWELSQAFAHMSDDVFFYHVDVGSGRNDFASWVSSVHQHQSLADSMSRAQSVKESEVAVLRHFVQQLR